MATEKQKALDNAILQVEKEHGKGAIMRLGEAKAQDVKSISTGLPICSNGSHKRTCVRTVAPASDGYKDTLSARGPWLYSAPLRLWRNW